MDLQLSTDYDIASIAKRIEAKLNSLFIICLFIIFGFYFFGTIVPLADFASKSEGEYRYFDRIICLIIVLAILTIFLLCGISKRATYGMGKAGIMFKRQDGLSLSIILYIKRVVLGFVLSPLCLVSIIAMAKDVNRRSISDRMCGTIVVKRRVPEKA